MLQDFTIPIHELIFIQKENYSQLNPLGYLIWKNWRFVNSFTRNPMNGVCQRDQMTYDV